MTLHRRWLLAACLTLPALGAGATEKGKGALAPDPTPIHTQAGAAAPATDSQEVIDLKARAKKGDVDAQYSLGLMYATGRNLPLDYLQAAKWFKIAAQKEDGRAQYGLGLMYEEGRGVSQDPKEAAKWYDKAAKQGVGEAQLNLGVMHYFGVGVAQDDVAACRWFMLAAARNVKGADRNVKKVSERMKPEQIAEAQKQAAAFVACKPEPAKKSAKPKAAKH